MTDLCTDCGIEMTDEESEYYETRCESCEIEHQARILLWKAGKPDSEMDRLYGVTIR